MKKLLYSLVAVAMLGSAANAQNVLFENCGLAAPEVRNNMTIEAQDVIGGAVWSTAPRLLSYDDNETPFPTVEFLITKGNNASSTDAGDFTIIGSSVDGVFYPTQMNRYGTTLVAGDKIRAVAIGYKKDQIQNLVDSLLTGRNAQAPCCDVVGLVSPDFCTTLAQSGITQGSDVHDLSQVLDVFDLFSSTELTINELVSSMSTVNSVASFLTGGCGGSLMPICFGIDPTNYHMYEISAANNIPIAVQELNAVTNFVIFPNPANNGIVNVAVETTQATDLQVNIFNALGQRMHSENLGAVNGQRTVTIHANNLSTGVYTVQITDGINTKASQLIVR